MSSFGKSQSEYGRTQSPAPYATTTLVGSQLLTNFAYNPNIYTKFHLNNNQPSFNHHHHNHTQSPSYSNRHEIFKQPTTNNNFTYNYTASQTSVPSTPIENAQQRTRIKLLEMPSPNQTEFTSNVLDNHSNNEYHLHHHCPDTQQYYKRQDDNRTLQNNSNSNSFSDSSYTCDKNPYAEYQAQQHFDLEKSSIYTRRGYRNSLRISENSPTLSNGRSNTLSQNCDS